MATKAAKPAASGGRFQRDQQLPARTNDSLVLVARTKLTVRQGWNPRTSVEVAEVEDLASSIVNRGMLTPLLVVATDTGYELVAGHRRVAAIDVAIAKGQLPKDHRMPAFLRDRESELADAVAENFNRVDLNPLEEAIAFGRMRDDMGLTAKGIAEQIGVAQRRVTERLRILELPEKIQAYYGTGELYPASVGPLLKCARVSVKLAERIADIAVVPPDKRSGLGYQLRVVTAANLTNDEGVERAAQAVAQQYPKEFVALHNWSIDAKLLPWTGKPDVSAKVGQLAKDHYADSAWIELSDQRKKQIEATGTVFGGVCVDPELVAENVQPLIERQHKALTRRAAAAKEKVGITPSKQEKADEAAKAYAEQRQAHAWNLRLGDALAKKFLTGVELSGDVVQLIAAMPMLDRDQSGTMGSDDYAVTLAMRGLRYVLPQWQEEKTTTKTTGRVKVTYLDQPDAHEKFWAWFDLATTPQEIAGRLVFALAAAVYADENAVPQSRKAYHEAFGWRGKTGPALVKKIAGKVVPAKTKAPAPKKRPDVPPGEWVGDEQPAAPAKGGTRAERVGALIRGRPGITIPELAEQLGLKQNLLYRVLPELERQGVVRKEGRGWHPLGADPEKAKTTELTALQARVLKALTDAVPAKGKTLAQTIRASVNAKLEAVTEAIEQLRELGLVANGEKAPYVTKQGGEVAAALDAKAAAA